MRSFTSPTDSAVLGSARRAGPSFCHTSLRTARHSFWNKRELFSSVVKSSEESFDDAADLNSFNLNTVHPLVGPLLNNTPNKLHFYIQSTVLCTNI